MTENIAAEETETYTSLSLNLFNVLEFIGTTVEKRDLKKNIKTEAEILRTLECDLFWGMFANNVFGSQYEDTTLTEMGSDEDVVLIFNRIEVVTGIQNNPEHSVLTSP